MTQSNATPKIHEELEAAASEVIGKIVLRLAGLEFDLGLCLRCLVAGPNLDIVNPLIDRLTFKSKLDALLEVVGIRFSSNLDCINDFKMWHKSVDEIRMRRNSFIHGRWGIHAYAGEMINVSPGMPGADPQKEHRYDIKALQQELKMLLDAEITFSRLRKKWQI